MYIKNHQIHNLTVTFYVFIGNTAETLHSHLSQNTANNIDPFGHFFTTIKVGIGYQIRTIYSNDHFN